MAEKTSILDIQIDAKQAIKSMSQIEEELETLKLAQKEIEKNSWKSQKQLQAENEQYATNAAKIKVLNNEMAGYRKQLTNQVKQERENEGSLVSMRAKLSNLRKEYDALSEIDREGDVGANLQKNIEAVNNALTLAEEKTGRFQRNVGNYYGAIMAAGNDLLSGTGPTQPTGRMGQSSENIKRQLKEMRDLQQQMKLAGLQGTKAFNDLSNAIGDAKDQVGDLEAETSHYASDTAKLDELRGAFDATGDAVSGVSSAMDAVGASSEAVAGVESRLSSASMAVNSAISVQNALQKQSALMLGIKRIQELAAAKATELLAAANGKATIAQKAFNMVAKANPYVLLATAILSVVGAVVAFSLATKNATGEQVKFNRAVGEYNKLKQEQQRNIERGDREIRNANENEVTELTPYEEAQAKLKTRNAAYNKLYDKRQEAENNLIDARANMSEEEIQKAQEEIDKMSEDLEELGAEIKELNDDSDAAVVEQQRLEEERARDAAIDRAERIKQAKETARQEQRAATDAEIANMRDGFNKQRAEVRAQYNNKIADLKLRLSTEKDLNAEARAAINRQITAAEKALQIALKKIYKEERADALNHEKELAEMRVEALKEGTDEYITAKMAALHRERDAELENAENTEEQKALIRAKYAKEEQAIIDEREQTKREKEQADREASNNAELLQMRNNGEKESAILKKQAEQMWDTFATMQQGADETTAQYQERVAQAYNDALNADKDAIEKQKEEEQAAADVHAKTIEQYGQLADKIGGVTEALAEGTGAEKDAKRISAGLGIVTGGLALAEGIEQAAKQKWPLNLAAIASVVGSIIPLISNIKTLAGYASGGYVSGLVGGGGSGTSDGVNARLSNGEYVVKANAVNASTLPLLNAMNGQQTGAEVGNNNFMAQQMALAFRSMPSPVVSVQDINKGQNRVQIIEQSAKMF